MMKRLSLLLVGIILLGLAAAALADIMRPEILIDIKRWFSGSGTQKIYVAGKASQVNTILLACLFCLIPLSLALGGLWFCLSALKRGNDDVA